MLETVVLVFSGNKMWMSETDSDPSSARILREDSLFNLLLKTFWVRDEIDQTYRVSSSRIP